MSTDKRTIKSPRPISVAAWWRQGRRHGNWWWPGKTFTITDYLVDYYDEDDEYEPCTWCGGDGFAECDDPIQCTTPGCDEAYCQCRGCNGRGYDQVVW